MKTFAAPLRLRSAEEAGRKVTTGRFTVPVLLIATLAGLCAGQGSWCSPSAHARQRLRSRSLDVGAPAAYVLLKPLRAFVTVNDPSACADTLIQ